MLASALVGWCALAWGIAAKDGRYGGWAMASVLLGVAATGLAVARHRPVPAPPHPSGRLPAAASPPGRGGPADGARPVTPDRHRSVMHHLRSVARRLPGSAWPLAALTLGLGPIVRHPRYYACGPLAVLADTLAIAAGLLAAAAIIVATAGPTGRSARLPRSAVPGRAPWARLGESAGLFWVVLGLACAAGIATVRAAPEPRIDVFHLLQVSAAGLPHGADMYRQQWAPSRAEYGVRGLFDVYPYLPWTSVLLAPFRLLLGDVRYGLLAALALAAACTRRLMGAARPGASGRGAGMAAAVLPLLVVIFPESMYALQQSWTEPLLVACLAVAVLAARGGRGWVALVAFALALAAKQHVVLLLPVAAAWPAFGVRRAAGAAGLAALLVAPWVLAGPRDFVDDAIWTNLHYQVLAESLSVPGWAAHFGLALGFGPALVALVAAYAAAWRARGDAAGFCLGAALVTATAALMNKQTFFNHYTLPMGLLVLAAAALAAAPSEHGNGNGQGERDGGGAREVPAPPPADGPQRSVENRSSDAPS
ncbi:PMT family glycosyltransferase, 4-amino-4-deoxy-L-arabinose transferase [Frankia canadensis]|uniref:PMT family glycosyltransferase, 4-amino-4-deoxy-L-arabinose transferase n=1 Tax=Frankia canadensis TaxID=1836972 RepID=A0A2I2KIN4_9ACTN|nr:PMT family glycosyltransferase, 4-amino-4-deoxy-L-arabinose transferase [Frankia canadensis]SOU52817.1 PMT family glycosyltransferase, 4-amino-4-deoxy-L-arabinose transferase [Frankia canadensis]